MKAERILEIRKFIECNESAISPTAIAGQRKALKEVLAELLREIEKATDHCPRSASPYLYCPLNVEFEDDYICGILADFARTFPQCGDASRMIDQFAARITAYMNGRIVQIVKTAREATSRELDEQTDNLAKAAWEFINKLSKGGTE